MICNNCGAEMRFEKDGHSVCWICDNCGNAVATTYFEQYETDQSVYHVLLSAPFKATTDMLKLVSEIANCNYIRAKKMIENAPIEIFQGKATEVVAIRKKMKTAGIEIKIEPEFPY